MGRTPITTEERAIWAEFLGDLRDAWTMAGRPDSREMARRLTDSTVRRSHTVLHNVIREVPAEQPSWGAVRAVLTACGMADVEIAAWRLHFNAVRTSIANRQETPAVDRGPSRLRCPALPNRQPGFRGRASLLAHVDGLLQAGRGPVVLEGLPGVGKTQLAVCAIRNARSRYDLVWWLDGRSRRTARAGLADLGRQLVRSSSGTLSDDDLVSVAQDELSRSDRWLIGVDNARDPLVIGSLLADVERGLLVTAAAGTWHDLGTVVDVKPLGITPSLQILGCSRTDKAARQLATKIGGVPLVLHQVAEVLRTGMSAAAYLDLVNADISTAVGAPFTPIDHPLTAEKAWTIRRRYVHMSNPKAARMFEALCFGAGSTIPFDLLAATDEADGRNTWPGSPADAAQAVRHLRSVALMQDSGRGGTIHGLLAGAVRSTLSDPDAARGELVRRMRASLTPGSDVVAGQQVWKDAYPHVIAVADRYGEDDPADGRERVWLIDRAATYLQARGDYVAAQQLMHRSEELAARHLDADDVLRAVTQGNRLLASYEADGGSAEILDQFRRLATLYERARTGAAVLRDGAAPVPADQVAEELADSYQNLGLIGLTSGSHADALTSLRAAVATYQQLWRSDDDQATHPSVARVWITLARALIEQHEFDDAVTAAQRGLLLVSRGPLANGYEHATALNNAALALQRSDPEQGARMMARVVQIRKAIYGPSHAQTHIAEQGRAGMDRHVGVHLKDARLISVAVRQHRELLAGFTAEYNAKLAGHRRRVAGLYCDLGRDHLERALLVQGRTGTSPTIAPTNPTRAESQRTTRLDLARAEDLLHKAVEIRETELPPEHPVLASTLNDLGRVKLAQKRPQAAADIFDRAAHVLRNLLCGVRDETARLQEIARNA